MAVTAAGKGSDYAMAYLDSKKQPLDTEQNCASRARPDASTGQYAAAEVSKEERKSISTPDSVKTSIGTLEFFDGVPTEDTVQKVYDNLDRMRGVQVVLSPSRLGRRQASEVDLRARTENDDQAITADLVQWFPAGYSVSPLSAIRPRT